MDNKLEVLRLKLPIETLRAMPVDDRTLFFAIGYAENQLNLMFKLLKFAANKEQCDETEIDVTGAQTNMILRHFIGAVAETCVLIDKRVFGALKYRWLVDGMSDAGRLARRQLNKRIGSGGRLHNIRNKFSFHIADDQWLEAGFSAASSDPAFADAWNIYVSPHGGLSNMLNFSADVVVAHAICASMGVADVVQAQRLLLAELMATHSDLIVVLDELSRGIAGKHFVEFDGTVVGVYEVPHIDDVSLPFFVGIGPHPQAHSQGSPI